MHVATSTPDGKNTANEMAIVIPMIVLMSIDAINVMAAVEIKIKLLYRCNFIEHRKFNALYFS